MNSKKLLKKKKRLTKNFVDTLEQFNKDVKPYREQAAKNVGHVWGQVDSRTSDFRSQAGDVVKNADLSRFYPLQVNRGVSKRKTVLLMLTASAVTGAVVYVLQRNRGTVDGYVNKLCGCGCETKKTNVWKNCDCPSDHHTTDWGTAANHDIKLEENGETVFNTNNDDDKVEDNIVSAKSANNNDELSPTPVTSADNSDDAVDDNVSGNVDDSVGEDVGQVMKPKPRRTTTRKPAPKNVKISLEDDTNLKN